MMRAVKDDNELMRLAAAGSRPTPRMARSCRGVSRAGRRPRSRLILLLCCGSSDAEQVDFTVVGSGPNGPTPS